MAEKYRVIHFINQFFAQIGGEEKADVPLSVTEGPVGPGLAFKMALQDEAEIVATFICGDNYFSEYGESIMQGVIARMGEYDPDIAIAGPAFNAGRYGPNCGALCKAVAEYLHIPAVTGMYEENPGVEMYRRDCYIVPTRNSAAGMRAAVPPMAALTKKLLHGEPVSPKADQYFAKGIRRNVFVEKTGAERAMEMLLAKIGGGRFETEMELPVFDSVSPAPCVKDLSKAHIGLVTDAGVTDKLNSFRLESARASKYLSLDVSGMQKLLPDDFCSVHGGFDTTVANINPNVLVPLDIMRSLVQEGKIGSLNDTLYSTTGNGTSLKNARQFGAEIADCLKSQNVDAVVLTST